MLRHYLTRRFRFSAAHRLHNPALDAAGNAAAFGPCAERHGHNYTVTVTVCGEPDPTTGFFCNVLELAELVRARLIDPCDHRDLETVSWLAGARPLTMERIAAGMWEVLDPLLTERGLHLHELGVAEDEDNAVRLRREPERGDVP